VEELEADIATVIASLGTIAPAVDRIQAMGVETALVSYPLNECVLSYLLTECLRSRELTIINMTMVRICVLVPLGNAM
jgi:hypothetical protein